MTEEVAALLGGDPASHVLLDDSWKVADLLRALSAAGVEAQVSILAARAATDTVFWTLWTPGGLPEAMREMGAGSQADLFERRILDEGKLQDYFNRDGMTRYRFGREPDGTPLNPGTGTTCSDVTAVRGEARTNPIWTPSLSLPPYQWCRIFGREIRMLTIRSSLHTPLRSLAVAAHITRLRD